MSIFSGIETVSAPNQSRWFSDGTYLCELHKFVQGKSQRDGTPYVAVEATILTVTAAEEDSNSEGERVSWVVMCRQQDTFLAAVGGFVSAAAGVKFDSVTADMCEELSAGDGTNLAGVEVVADAKTIITKSGNPFMKVVWRSTIQ